MLKKIVIVLIAIASIGTAAPTTANARGWRGGGRGFYRGGFGRGWGYRGFAYPAYGAYGAYGCWRTVRVFTPWGPRLRRMWVC